MLPTRVLGLGVPGHPGYRAPSHALCFPFLYIYRCSDASEKVEYEEDGGFVEEFRAKLDVPLGDDYGLWETLRIAEFIVSFLFKT